MWKQRTDLSYRDVGTFDTFAQRGHVVTESAADTLLIDNTLGLEIQFDSVDDEVTVRKVDMATLPPGRLHDVSNAADFVALTETNFEILTAEVFKQEPTYVSAIPEDTRGRRLSARLAARSDSGG